MIKKALTLFTASLLLILSSCGNNAKSEKVEDLILDAAEVDYNTTYARIDSIGTEYYVQSEFRDPYTQNIFISESGVIGKLYMGSEIEEGELICEELIDGLEDELEKQKLITDAAEDTYNNLIRSGVAGAELEYAQINYESEKIKYDKLLDKAENAKIYAPCSGRIKIDTDSIYAGAEVYAGQYLGQIADSGQTYLCAFVYYEPLADVNFGSKVQIIQGNVVNTEGKVIDIIYVDRGADYSGYYYVIDTPEDAGFLDFGTIDVIFNIDKKDGAVVIPKTALKQIGTRQYVNVIIDGTKVEIDVETGISNDRDIEITSGLSGGEEIIVT